MVALLSIFVLGLLIGSFINAVVWRLHSQAEGRLLGSRRHSSELSILRGRSMCPNCRHQLAARDLVPVLSWVFLRGSCRYCQKTISAQYPLVELLTAVLFGLSLRSLLTPHSSLLAWVNLGFWLYFLTTLIILAVYDLRWMLLPDKVLLPAIIVAFAQLVINLALGQPIASLHSPLLAALLAGGAFYALAAVSKGRWMGGGDIKLVFLMGLVLGGPKTIVAMFLAFNSAAIVGLSLIGLKIKSRRDHIPFGPFLVAATVVSMLYGHGLIVWYLSLVGL